MSWWGAVTGNDVERRPGVNSGLQRKKLIQQMRIDGQDIIRAKVPQNMVDPGQGFRAVAALIIIANGQGFLGMGVKKG